jgi:hypothetical protein
VKKEQKIVLMDFEKNICRYHASSPPTQNFFVNKMWVLENIIFKTSQIQHSNGKLITIRSNKLGYRVADRIRAKSWIRIRIKVKIQELQRLKIETRGRRFALL